MTRPRAAGWRQRRGLGLIGLDGWSWGGAAALVRALGAARVNLPLMLLNTQQGRTRGGLALEEAALPAAAELARRLAAEHRCPAPVPRQATCALILYPLAGDLALPLTVLGALAGVGISPLALGTSPAALTLLLPDDELPGAVYALGRSLELPAGPQPEVVSVVQSSQRREV